MLDATFRHAFSALYAALSAMRYRYYAMLMPFTLAPLSPAFAAADYAEDMLMLDALLLLLCRHITLPYAFQRCA